MKVHIGARELARMILGIPQEHAGIPTLYTYIMVQNLESNALEPMTLLQFINRLLNHLSFEERWVIRAKFCLVEAEGTLREDNEVLSILQQQEKGLSSIEELQQREQSALNRFRQDENLLKALMRFCVPTPEEMQSLRDRITTLRHALDKDSERIAAATHRREIKARKTQK